MKNKIIAAVVAGFALFSLASCSQSVFDMYKGKASLPKDNVYEIIDADQLVSMVQAPIEDSTPNEDTKDEMIFVFLGNPEVFDAAEAIVQVNTQAVQYLVETVYYLPMDDYDTSSKRKELQNKIGINDASKVPGLITYRHYGDGVDTMKKAIVTDSTLDSQMKELDMFVADDNGNKKLDFVKLAEYQFNSYFRK